MLQGFKNIKYYIVCMLLAFGLYTYGAISGTLLFGDDNLNTDGHAVNSTGGHYYGHGYFFHK
jgi:hypothetical protein